MGPLTRAAYLVVAATASQVYFEDEDELCCQQWRGELVDYLHHLSHGFCFVGVLRIP